MCSLLSRMVIPKKKILKTIHDATLVFQDDFFEYAFTYACLEYFSIFFMIKISRERQNNTELTSKSELIIKEDEYYRSIKIL